MLNGISILENVTIINPQKTLEFGQQKCIDSFQGSIQYVARISIVLTAVAGKSCLEYSKFLTTYLASKKDVFEKFDRKTQRLDHFYFENFDTDDFPNYQ